MPVKGTRQDRDCVMAALGFALHAGGSALIAVQAVKLRVSQATVSPKRCKTCVIAALEVALDASYG